LLNSGRNGKEQNMSELHHRELADNLYKQGPESALERVLLEEYLTSKGYHLIDLNKLPEEKVKALMTEASRYASLKLAQVESTAHFREEIRRVI
jgi:hypothetical protein